MKDLNKKADRLKELIVGSKTDGPTDAQGIEMAGIGIDLLVELISNTRRIAFALEKQAGIVR